MEEVEGDYLKTDSSHCIFVESTELIWITLLLECICLVTCRVELTVSCNTQLFLKEYMKDSFNVDCNCNHLLHGKILCLKSRRIGLFQSRIELRIICLAFERVSQWNQDTSRLLLRRYWRYTYVVFFKGIITVWMERPSDLFCKLEWSLHVLKRSKIFFLFPQFLADFVVLRDH